MNVRDFINQQGAELSALGFPQDRIKGEIEKKLLFRGVPLEDLKKGLISDESFFSLDVSPTVREHIDDLAAQGLTKEQVELDMAERGFYDVDRNVKENKNELLPEKLDTVRHKEIMGGSKILGLIPWDQPWREAMGSGRFSMHDPWKIPQHKKTKDRIAGIRAGMDTTTNEQVKIYMDYLEARDAGGVVKGGMREEFSRPEPDVAPGIAEKARQIYKVRNELAAEGSKGAITGLGRSVAAGAADLWGEVPVFGGTDEQRQEIEESRVLASGGGWRDTTGALVKESDQTRYFKVPVVDDKGRQVKNKAGKPKFKLIESEEELLKLNQGRAFTDARKALDKLAEQRLSGGLNLPEKGREEIIDIAQGMSDLAHMLLPMIKDKNAIAMAVQEQMESNPNFDYDQAKFEEAMAGYQGGAGVTPALLAYLAPIANSMAVNYGLSDRMLKKESEMASGPFGVPLPITQQLKNQAQAFPVDTMLMMIPVTKLLKGMGSIAAAELLARKTEALRRNGVSEAKIADFEKINIENYFSKQQKSALRRVLESSLIKETESKFLRALGPSADALTTAAKGAALAVTLGDTTGALGEAAVYAGIGGATGGLSAALRASPSLRRSLTPEIWASESPYIEATGRAFADTMADSQNIIDSPNIKSAYQAGRGEIAAIGGVPGLENLPAAIQDNAARLWAAVDTDPLIVNLKNTVKEMTPDTPDYAAAVSAVEEARRSLFIELAEDSGFVRRENGHYEGLTNINRERGEVNRLFDEEYRAAERTAQEEIGAVAEGLDAEVSTSAAIDELPARRERIDLAEAEAKVDYDLSIAEARTARDEALADVAAGTKQRVQRAEARLGKAKEEYAASRRKAKETDDKLRVAGEARLAKAKSAKVSNKAKKRLSEEMSRLAEEGGDFGTLSLEFPRRERLRRIKAVKDETLARRKRAQERYAATHQRMKAKIQRLTEAKQIADKKIGSKKTVAQRLLDIDESYSRIATRLKKRRDKQQASIAKDHFKLDLEENRLQKRAAIEEMDIQNSRLFAEGAISFDELVSRRNAASAEGLLEGINIADRDLSALRAKRDADLDVLYTKEQDILNSMKNEYETTIQYKDGIPLSDPLFKKKVYHVVYDLADTEEGAAFQAVPKDLVDDATIQNGVDVVTYQDPAFDAGALSNRLSQMPVSAQLEVLKSIEKAAGELARGTKGVASDVLKGGGTNAAYRYIHRSMTTMLFDEFSPKFLRSNEMRAAFKDFVSNRLANEFGVPNTSKFVTDIEKLVNNFASPRLVEKALFTEIGYTFYGRKRGRIVPIANLADIYKDFLKTQVPKSRLRRIAVEAIQSDLPVLQARVGVSAATETMLRQSSTNLLDFTRGVYHKGEVNWPYVKSIVDTFNKENHLPVTFRIGNKVIIESDGVRKQSRSIIKALFIDRDADVRRILGPEKYTEFRRAIDAELVQIDEVGAPRKYRFINSMDTFNKLDDFRVIGEGAIPDQLKGIKTLHPAITADRIKSSIGAFTEKSASKSDILVHSEFGETVGWLLKTNDWYTKQGTVWQMARGLTALFKLTKTALNPLNHITNFLSNYTTLALSEGFDPITAGRVISQGGIDMLLYRFSPERLPLEVRQQFDALMETGGLNQTILVQEVDAVLQQLQGQGGRAYGMATALITGRFPDGRIPFSKVDGTIGYIARAPFEFSSLYTEKMKTGYRLFGDEMFKFIKARLDMIENASHLEKMRRGTGQSFFDLSRGQYTSPPFLGHVHKDMSGNFMVIRADGRKEKGRQAVLKLNAEASMASANAYYFNLGDLGTLQRKAVLSEGLGLSAFLSWRIHSADIPGLKKGLFYRTLIDDSYRFSTDSVVAGDMAASQIAKASRRALVGLAMKRRDAESYDIRRALPSYMRNAFIYSDLSLLVADNQIPFSGMLDYISNIGKMAEMADPKGRKRRLFWDTIFAEKNKKGIFKDWISPPFTEAMRTIFGTDPMTNEAFKTKMDWLDGVVRTLGDGRVLVARRALQIYIEQNAATTIAEIEGTDKKLIQKRSLLENHSNAVSILQAMLMRRYQKVNPMKMIDLVANAPKSAIDSMFRRLEQEYAIPVGDRDLVNNTFDFLIGRNINENNARLEDELVKRYKDLFGEEALNHKTRPGDTTKIKGTYGSIALRLFQQMESSMNKEGRAEFKAAYMEAIKNGLTADDEISKELEEMHGVIE